MGLLVEVDGAEMVGDRRPMRAFLTVGILGGFTTFSSFALDTATLAARHDTMATAFYVAGSVALSILGFYAGMALVRHAHSMSGVQTLTVAADEADLRLDRWFKRHFPDVDPRPAGEAAAHRPDPRRRQARRVQSPPDRRAPPFACRHCRGAGAAGRTEPRPVSAKDARALQASRALQGRRHAGDRQAGGSGGAGRIEARPPSRCHARCPAVSTRPSGHASCTGWTGTPAACCCWPAMPGRQRRWRRRSATRPAARPTGRSWRACRRSARARSICRWRNCRGAPGERVVPDEEGKSAVTDYRVLDHAGKKAAWLELWPLTGRTHQLRAHCAALGTPILGDGKYGGAKAHLNHRRPSAST